METNIVLVLSGSDTNVFQAILPDEGLVRRILPASISQPTFKEFQAGISYGLPFDEIVPINPDFGKDLANALHNAGIWTNEDLYTHAQDAVSAIQSACKIDLGKLIQAAEAYKPKQVKAPVTTKKTQGDTK